MSTSRFAIFVDLENCGAKAPTLNNILDKVKIRGDILLGKVYGYTDRFSELKELLLSNTFTVVPSLRHGVAQKNNADILLDHHTPALHLIQRIRDEAHRFAITHHRGLREKNATRSVLDDIPGIGAARRRALLQYFKSVKAIREADMDALLACPKMNKTAAEAVYSWAHPDGKT